MANAAPAYQEYAADYLADETIQLFTLEEEGAYNRLKRICWREGSIPADLTMLSRLCKGGSTTMLAVVVKCFKPHPNDPARLVLEELERERIKQAEWRAKSAEGGRRSAETRAKNAGATTLQPPLEGWCNTSSSFSSSTSTKRQRPKDSPRSREGKTDERFQAFVGVLRDYWIAANPSLQFDFSAVDGRQLKTLLAQKPSLSSELFQKCLQNRLESDAVTHSEDVSKWIVSVLKYAGGPLDQYQKPKGNDAEPTENRARRSAAEDNRDESRKAIGAAVLRIAGIGRADEPNAELFQPSADHRGNGHGLDQPVVRTCDPIRSRDFSGRIIEGCA